MTTSQPASKKTASHLPQEFGGLVVFVVSCDSSADVVHSYSPNSGFSCAWGLAVSPVLRRRLLKVTVRRVVLFLQVLLGRERYQRKVDTSAVIAVIVELVT